MPEKIGLTFLRHGSNAALLVGTAALAVWFAVSGSFPIGWIVLGALLFYASEYGWHRFAFHAPPAPWPFLRKAQHRLHYDHHAEPNRLDLLFLPLWFLVPVLAINAAIFGLILGAAAVPPLALGILLAILHYEWTHYVAHIPYEPRTAWGRYIKRYHLRHHFISEQYWFGVSNPGFDYLYRTCPDPRTVKKSAFVRDLFGERSGEI